MHKIPHPLHDRILVRRAEEAPEPTSGIVIPDAAKEKPLQGTVVAVGRGRYERGEIIPLDVAVDDVILFGKYAGSEIKVNGEDLIIMREEEALCIL